MSNDDLLYCKRHTCAHCGASDVGTFGAGYASVGDQYLCHPNSEDRPDCYQLVTVFRHPMPCPRCPGSILLSIPW